MGCGPSKIDQEETVAMCKDRKRFIREAVAARNGLAAAHSAYADSLKNTGAALSDYVQGESLATSDIQRVQNNLAITSSARRAVADTPADSIYPPPPPDAPGEGSETLAPLRLMSSAALVEMAKNKGKAPMYASVTQEEDSRDYGNVDEIVAPRSVPSALPPPPPPPPPPPRKKGKVVSLLQVLNELDKDFLKASASAHNVLKSLEAVRMHYHSNFADNRGYIDHSARVLEVITWNRSPKDDTENEETKKEFDKDHEWDTHATVLDKIAALEKKLYDEVKEVEIMKMAYTDKLESLNKKKRRGAGSKSIERTRSFASHLHTKYVVAMQTMESTLSEIDRLRDSQLYPKLVELVDGLGRMWEAMCEHHSKQRKTISVLKHWEVVGMLKQTTEQHHDRTVQLFQIVQEWHVQFHKLTSYQKGYVHSLTNWLLLNLVPIDTDVRKKPQQHQEPDTPIQEPEVSDEQQEPLPIEMLLRGWSACLEQLQHEVAGTSIVTFAEVAFKTGDFSQQVVFLGGLTDGLLATQYIEPLSIALENNNWSLVQPLLSSSYIGYGTSSLEQDALEIDQLINYLINNENSEGVVLLGHSTGCQDIVHYMKTNFACSKAVRGVILQAPVSDREYRATLPETPALIDLAAKMINDGKGNELMPREADSCAPITAYRYHSLCAYMGDDDMFSSDLSEDQLRQRLGHMASTRCQVIFSMADEYVPEYVDKKALVNRLCQALGGAEKVEIEYGNHALSNRVQEAVEAIVDFVKREGPNGWDDPWS